MIVVTGGTGFIGRRLVERLLAKGETVRVLTRSPPAEPAGRFAPIDGPDLTDNLSGARALVHLAGHVGGGDLEAMAKANVETTGRLARAAAEAGVKRFVHVSSGAVYGARGDRRAFTEADPLVPKSAYEVTKAGGEQAVRDALSGGGVAWTILRPTGVFGPGRDATEALFRSVAERRFWLHGPAYSVMNPLFVEDAVAAMMLAIDADEAPGEVFNIGGADAVSYGRLIAAMAKALGRPAPLQIVLQPRPVNRVLDIGKARARLGFSPAPLDEALAETAQWFLSRPPPA